MLRWTVLFLAIAFLSSPAATAEKPDTVQRGLTWLARAIEEDAPENLDANRRGHRLCGLAVAGFLMEQYPEDESLATARGRIEAELTEFLKSDHRSVLSTWTNGFVGLWLAERRLRGAPTDELYRLLLPRLKATQNAEGGWAHAAPASMGDMYPSTLIASSSWCLLGAGLAERIGVEVDEDVVGSGTDLLLEVQGRTGAFPYGGRNSRMGYEAGRTASAFVALLAVGRGDTNAARRAATYLLRNAAGVPGSHSSPPMHVLAGGLAYTILGDEARALYEREVLTSIRRYQKDDGSFAITAWAPGAAVDPSRDLFETACCSAAIGMARSRVAALLANPLKTAGPATIPAPTALPRAWGKVVSGMIFQATAGGNLVALIRDGGLVGLDPATGKAKFTASRPAALTESLRPCWLLASPTRILVGYRDIHAALPGTRIVFGGEPEQEKEPEVRDAVAAFDTTDGTLLWNRWIPGAVAFPTVGRRHVAVLTQSGRIVVMDQVNGEEVARMKVPKRHKDNSLTVNRYGAVAAGNGSRLFVWNEDGEKAWSQVRESLPGRGPAVHNFTQWLGEDVATARSDGTVVLADGETGEPRWTTRLPASVAMFTAGADGSRLFALDFEGSILALHGKTGEVAWRYDPPRARDALNPTPFQDFGTRLVAPYPHLGRTFLLDPETGRELEVVPTGPRSRVLVIGDYVFRIGGEQIEARHLRKGSE